MSCFRRTPSLYELRDQTSSVACYGVLGDTILIPEYGRYVKAGSFTGKYWLCKLIEIPQLNALNLRLTHNINAKVVADNDNKIDLMAFDGRNVLKDVTKSNDADGNAVIDLTRQGDGMLTLLGIGQGVLCANDFIFS